MKGCGAKQGMCIHDKLMVLMGLMVAVAAVAHWGFHLV
jgi:hypothetical protein